MVAFGRFGQHLQVLLQFLARGPSSAVDALQHRPGHVAAPVRPCNRLELERSESARTRYMGAGAHVAKGAVGTDVAVRVVADRRRVGDLAGVFTGRRPGHDSVDDLGLVEVVGKELLGFRYGQFVTHERLVSGDDLGHPRLDLLQITLRQRPGVGQFDVVVEAVLDGRPYCQLGARMEVEDRLGQNMSGRVTNRAQSDL